MARVSCTKIELKQSIRNEEKRRVKKVEKEIHERIFNEKKEALNQLNSMLRPIIVLVCEKMSALSP